MILALAGQKGGAGKSTLAVCLAVEALARGQRVLLVDADPQGTARTWAEVAAEAQHPTPTAITMGASMHRDGQLRALERAVDSGDPARLALAAGVELPDAVIRWAYVRWEGDLAELPVIALWHLGTGDVVGGERVLDAWEECLGLRA